MSVLTPAQLGAMLTFAGVIDGEECLSAEQAHHAAVAIRMLVARVRELESEHAQATEMLREAAEILRAGGSR